MQSSISAPKDRPYAVAEVLVSPKELFVFPVATVWLQDLKACFDDDGKSITKATIFWPTEDDQLSDMLIRRPVPDVSSGKWVKGTGTILKFCRTLGSAKEGAEKAEIDSSLESDGVVIQSKRARKPPVRFSPDDSECESSEEMKDVPTKRIRKSSFNEFGRRKDRDQRDKPPLLLELHHRVRNQVEKGSETSPNSSQRDTSLAESMLTEDTVAGEVHQNENLQDAEPMSNNDNDSHVDANDDANDDIIVENFSEPHDKSERGSSGSTLLASPDTEAGSVSSAAARFNLFETTPSRKDGSLQRTRSSNQPRVRSSPRKLLSPLKSLAGHASSGVTSLTFVREMKVLNDKLDSLNIKVSAIYMTTCESATSVAKKKLDIPILPVQTSEDLRVLEEFVSKGDEQQIAIVNVLSEFGGATLKDATIGIMKHLLSNSIARLYNMEGINRKSGDAAGSSVEKIGLRGSFLHKLVHAAIKKKAAVLLQKRTVNIQYNTKVCDGIIGGWLKDAPQRYKNEMKKSARRDQPSDSAPAIEADLP